MSMGIVIPSGDTLPLEEREFTGLGDYQAAVGGFIAPVDIEDRGITVYVNDEGIVMGLPINARATALWWLWSPQVRNRDALFGDAVIVGLPDHQGDTTSEPPWVWFLAVVLGSECFQG